MLKVYILIDSESRLNSFGWNRVKLRDKLESIKANVRMFGLKFSHLLLGVRILRRRRRQILPSWDKR